MFDSFIQWDKENDNRHHWKTIRFIIIWFFKKTFGELDSRLNKKTCKSLQNIQEQPYEAL